MYTLPVVQDVLNEVHKFAKVNPTLLPIQGASVYIQKVLFYTAAGSKVQCLIVRNGAEHDDKELGES
jgi:hypothetical protein